MTTLIIDDKCTQAKQFIRFAGTLPFATVVKENKKNFEESAAECDAVSVDSFFDELDERIKKRFNA
jgi:hypothetical protein